MNLLLDNQIIPIGADIYEAKFSTIPARFELPPHSSPFDVLPLRTMRAQLRDKWRRLPCVPTDLHLPVSIECA